MKLSRESWHALNVLSHLARAPEGAVLESATLAEALRIPQPFLSKILQRLAQSGIVKGHRGAVRGYSLAHPAASICASNVVESVEGPDFFEACIFAKESCSNAHPCSLHDEWARVRPELRKQLERLTIAQLATRKKRRVRR